MDSFVSGDKNHCRPFCNYRKSWRTIRVCSFLSFESRSFRVSARLRKTEKVEVHCHETRRQTFRRSPLLVHFLAGFPFGRRESELRRRRSRELARRSAAGRFNCSPASEQSGSRCATCALSRSHRARAAPAQLLRVALTWRLVSESENTSACFSRARADELTRRARSSSSAAAPDD